MKKVFFLILIFFSSITVVNANTISNIDMDIYVDNNGTATITEIWNATVTEGTEGWHPYYNIGKSEIYDVKAKMDNIEFTTLEYWNENSSLSEKAYKTGLYYPTSNEVDIVFGISNYGTHKYEIQYKISNFVSTTNDADMIYWNLFPYNFSAEPGNVTIKIYSDFKYDDNWDVWGYGKYGAPCYIYNGVIKMTSDGVINSSEYLTLLAKFPKGTFQTKSILNNNFNYYYELANNGITPYKRNTETKQYKIKEVFQILQIIFVFILFYLPLILLLIINEIYNKYNKKKNKNIKFGNAGNKIKNNVPYFRDIPCKKDIFRAYLIADCYNLKKKKEDFLGAVILKWLKNDNVTLKKNNRIENHKSKKGISIIFEERPNTTELEGTLYDYMQEASIDGTLEINEFKKWCHKNSKKILNWYKDILNQELNKLANEGKVQILIKGKILKRKKYMIDDSIMIEAEQLKGLQKFLKDFTTIEKREPIEVKLWHEYLMFAQIFGIAEEVAKQFKKLYPEIIQDMEELNYNYNDIQYIHYITSRGFKSAYNTEHRGSSGGGYSSGGGGYSSGGGGGGSFGGGSGGGGFR